MSIEQFDALFVINQSVDLEKLSRSCVDQGYRRALVVTSHRLFAAEVHSLKQAALPCDIRVSHFSDWLDDAQMQLCDDEANATLNRGSGGREAHFCYAERFAAESLYLKNRAVHQALLHRFRWRKTHYSRALGISPRYWQEQGAERVEERTPTPDPGIPSGMLSTLRVSLRFLAKATHLERVDDGRRIFLFTSTRRLALRSDVRTQPVIIGRWSKIVAALRGLTIVPARILRRIVGEDAVIATTIHAYPSYLAADTGSVQVFLDGFHPANYPRTYLGQYGPCVFVSTDPLSTEWFTKYGRTVVPAPAFIDAKPMQSPAICGAIKRILLALNHAGDWTALINRSDTDALFEAFCNVAPLFPAMHFVVRPHPTMAHPAHEGESSRHRLERYVRSLSLPNLSVSEASLGEDLENSDVVVSEYSQVLIDAFRTGKLGLIVNLTGRRSFMADYEACGFSHVDDERGLAEWIRETVDTPDAAVERQACAVQRYNAVFEALMAGRSRATSAVAP